MLQNHSLLSCKTSWCECNLKQGGRAISWLCCASFIHLSILAFIFSNYLEIISIIFAERPPRTVLLWTFSGSWDGWTYDAQKFSLRHLWSQLLSCLGFDSLAIVAFSPDAWTAPLSNVWHHLGLAALPRSLILFM